MKNFGSSILDLGLNEREERFGVLIEQRKELFGISDWDFRSLILD